MKRGVPLRGLVPRPFTRVPIKPVQRHADARVKQPKHKHKETE